MVNLRRQKPEINIDAGGYIVDERTGLIIPGPYHSKVSGSRSKIGGLIAQRLADMGIHNLFNPSEGYYSFGYYLDRQESTMLPNFHRKGSVESELMLAALADGEIGNIGIGPVVWPLLNAVLQNQIAKTQSVTLNLTGKESPVNIAMSGLNRFNDSPLGFVDSLKKLVYGYRVFNRGQPISTIPFHFATNEYDDFGMEIVAIDAEKQQYHLEVNWDRVGRIVPYLPDPLRCVATNNKNWPYWYYHEDIEDKPGWILLHKSHIIPVIPGESLQAGLGTSALWITLGFLTDYFLVVEHRAERKINKLVSGLIGISGISEEADDVRAELELAKEEQTNEGRYFGAEYAIFASDDKPINFSFLPLRQGDDIDDRFREENYQDILAQAFQEPLAGIVMRGGMGLGSRMSEDASDQQAEVGVATILNAVSHALECIFNTVEIDVVQPNNRAKQLNIKTFTEFSTGVSKLADGTLTIDEIRAIINRDIFEIPKVDEETVSTTDGNDPIEPSDSPRDEQDEQENSKLVSNLDLCIRYLEPFVPAGADSPILQTEPDSESVTDDSFDNKFNEYEGMLSSAIWDEEANPPDSVSEPRAEPGPNDNNWYWQLSVLEFLRRLSLRKVQRVTREDTTTIRDDLAGFAIEDNNGLAAELSLGAISIQEWVSSMKSIVQDDFTQAFLMGIGGRDSLRGNDTLWLNSLLLERFREIEGLGADIASGLYSEAQVANFGRNIVSGSVAAYEAANSTNFGLVLGLIELPEYPGTVQICRGNCRCKWDLTRDGNIVYATWVLNPAAKHCASCLGNADRWNPLIIDLEA